MPIEQVRKTYEAALANMGEDFKKRGASDSPVYDAKRRMDPLSYSLDVAWRQRMQSFNDTVINDPRIGRVDGPDKKLLMAVDSINNTGLEQRLKEWLVEADPFKEQHEENAIAERGEGLLEAIRSSYELAAQRDETRQLQPDLYALAQRVRDRLAGFEKGVFVDLPKAVSVPHEMYLELRDAIDRSKKFPRDKIEKKAGRGDPNGLLANWDNGLAGKIKEVAKYPNHPLFPWLLACEKILPRSNTVTQGREYILNNIFESRDLQGQMNNLYNTINGDRDARDYVMKVREAAWSVQGSIDLYLRAIDDKWGGGQEDLRDSLNQTLCAVADRVLKEVNFVITAKLARSGYGPDGGQ